MSQMRSIVQQIRFPVFLIALLFFLIAYPYFHLKFPEQIAIVEVFFAMLLVAGVSLLIDHRKLLVVMVIHAILILFGILLWCRILPQHTTETRSIYPQILTKYRFQTP